ncbi:hypothetical protein [Pseudomonas sp. BN515]|uniref:hypothetical protein n=1 Tax=Pseudomonas sp. BN515 TaxID=2567892 RepID=UPI00245837CD|nr:hypothetical protein [Pseudomonas sp. BN515]MDH4871563.1 hypothetical protein [Pseudomonas sp. BN515]
MLNKLLPSAFIASVLIGCVSKETMTNESPSLADDNTLLVGIWAMLPLRNGIANVAEYRSDGKVLLYPFNCAKPSEMEIETSDYVVAKDGHSIHIKSPMREFDLKVMEFKNNAMRLGMSISGSELTFAYLKIDKVAPLCALYTALDLDANATPYQESDFVPAPSIPAHEEIERYIGDWGNDQNELQISLARNAQGHVYLYMSSNENWHYLYNDAHWIGDELHFQSYAYSENEKLFRHPYHKSRTATILRPTDDGKMKHSFFIRERRFDYVLTRMKE